MNKPVYLGQVILDLSKTLMYEFCYDYMRPKYGSKVKLCYMDTGSFVYEIEIEDFYTDIASNVEKRFNTSGYSKNDSRPSARSRIQKSVWFLKVLHLKTCLLDGEAVIGLMKDELGGKIMTEFVALMAKMYAYRKIDKEVEEKRCKDTEKCVVSEGLTFEDLPA